MAALERYVVELHPPQQGWAELQAVAARARAAAEQVSADGTPVRFLRSVFVPEDDSCLFLFEAETVAAVGEAGRLAALEMESVAEVVRVDDYGRQTEEE